MDNTQTSQTIQPVKIYRDGRLSRLESSLPVIKQNLAAIGNKIDYWFVNHEWPR